VPKQSKPVLVDAHPVLVPAKLQSRILEVRGLLIMLDRDLAELYGVETGALNRAVKRNIERFPADFMFQLTEEEAVSLRCQNGTSNAEPGLHGDGLRSQIVTSNVGRGGRRYPPYAFTEQGVAMLSGVLRSERAVHVNIAIMRAFVELRRWVSAHEELARKLSALERKSDEQYQQVMKIIERLVKPKELPQAKIGYRKPGK